MINNISIIIPALNEEKYLPRLLQCIQNQSFPGKLEVIVVDGQSTDKTKAIASSFNTSLHIKVISSERGISKQRNRGAELATYPHLLFLDADMVFSTSFLTDLLVKVNPDEQLFATVFCQAADADVISRIFVIGITLPFLLIMYFEKIVPGFLIITTKKLHKKIQGFDESIVLAEDIDYGIRARKAGGKYRLFFSPIAYHSVRRMKKMGRIRFVWFYFSAYYHFKKYGFEKTVKQSIPQYPFGHY